MPTKKDISRLLKKELSGLEAGRLAIEHLAEVEHGRKGFLTELDIAHIRSGLRIQEDRDMYRSVIDTYSTVSRIVKEAHILTLHIVLELESLRRLLRGCWLDWQIKSMQQSMPVFMTQKQKRAARRKHKNSRLQELSSLREVLEQRAYELATQEQQEECELDPGCLAEEHPELLERAAEQVFQLIRSGKLGLVQLSEGDAEKLEGIEEQIQSRREKLLEKERGMFEAREIVIGGQDEELQILNEEFSALYEERDESTQQAYMAAKREESTDVALLLEQLEDVPLDSEEADRVLDYTYCSGEDLCRAELPEWVEWIDDTTAGLPGDVAIIEDPTSRAYSLHKNGYYKIDLSSLSPIGRIGTDLRELLRDKSETLGTLIAGFLINQGIVEAASQVIGSKLTEDVDNWYRWIEEEVAAYNDLVHLEIELENDGYKVKYVRQDLMGSLKPIHIERLSSDAMQAFREDMAARLGIKNTA